VCVCVGKREKARPEYHDVDYHGEVSSAMSLHVGGLVEVVRDVWHRDAALRYEAR